jgi:hypothetical protein
VLKSRLPKGAWEFQNCGGTSQCVIQAHVRDGVVIRVEPDDRFNQNAGRADPFLSDNDLILNNLQRRPCTTVITVSGVEA